MNKIELTVSRQTEELLSRFDAEPIEVFNTALSLLGWAATQLEAGRVVASIDEKSLQYKELWMPLFDQIKHKE